jgi:thiol-disulfide isomerase/thioredoxin
MNWNKAANMAMIVAACVVIRLALKDRRSAPKRVQTSVTQRYMGKPLPLPDRSALGSAATTVLFVSKSCHYCADSMPFYEQLSAARKSRKLSVVVAVPQGRETREDGAAFFAEHRVSIDAVFPLDFAEAGVAGTPTLVLLDGVGRVKAAWSGILPSDKQAEVLSRINALIAAPQPG